MTLFWDPKNVRHFYDVEMKKIRKKSLKELLKPIDEEARKQKIYFTREEAVADDLFDD